MNVVLTRMKLISITCEQSLEKRVLAVLRSEGALRARVSKSHVEEFDGSPAVDLLESQIKIECIVTPASVGSVVDEFSRQFLARFDLGFFVSDVEVLRPEIFCR